MQSLYSYRHIAVTSHVIYSFLLNTEISKPYDFLYFDNTLWAHFKKSVTDAEFGSPAAIAPLVLIDCEFDSHTGQGICVRPSME
jgi:hypothetical protein